MRKKTIVLMCSVALIMAAFLSGCASMNKASDSNFKDPVVTLSHVEVQKYWGWWFYGDKVEPTKGTAGNNAAPLALAYIWEIKNPNSYPVELQEFKFTVAFEDFDLDTVILPDSMWIPAGKTNELRALSVFDARSAQMSLLVTGGFKLQERGISFWDALEKYWTQIPDFSFPVYANQGSALFKADGVARAVSFNATFP
ncbi:MAG: hypothetical protein JRE88_04695 [Deltaproteobacteria bacterium]|jgi:hypothetical protein|nr:hypothetical protein [Deltaproteobacteria bacterium]MBW2516060.1 hypothetical protein [Deltaproteobacteria bacterium]